MHLIDSFISSFAKIVELKQKEIIEQKVMQLKYGTGDQMRLIDADKLVGGIAMAFCVPCVEQGNDHDGVRCRACQYGDMIEIIECSPTIDVEPVIRCED